MEKRQNSRREIASVGVRVSISNMIVEEGLIKMRSKHSGSESADIWGKGI